MRSMRDRSSAVSYGSGSLEQEPQLALEILAGHMQEPLDCISERPCVLIVPSRSYSEPVPWSIHCLQAGWRELTGKVLIRKGVGRIF